MAAGAAEHKKMPDEMAIALVIVQEKDDAGRVDNSAAENPEQRRQRHRVNQRSNGEDNEPAHPEIQRDRQSRSMLRTQRSQA